MASWTLVLPFMLEEYAMRKCKICGAPIEGKAKYCDKCRKQRKREYQKNHYQTNEDYRRKKLNNSKKQNKKPKLGTLSDYSHHARADFNQEAKIVTNMKKKSFKGKPNGKNTKNNGDDYNKVAYQNYNSAIRHEEAVKDSIRKCEVCGSTHLEREHGEIVCQVCGFCYPIFCMSAFGFPEIDHNDDFIRALAKLGRDKNE